MKHSKSSSRKRSNARHKCELRGASPRYVNPASSVGTVREKPLATRLSRPYIHDFSEVIKSPGLAKNAPFDSPLSVVPFQYSHMLQDDAQVG